MGRDEEGAGLMSELISIDDLRRARGGERLSRSQRELESLRSLVDAAMDQNRRCWALLTAACAQAGGMISLTAAEVEAHLGESPDKDRLACTVMDKATGHTVIYLPEHDEAVRKALAKNVEGEGAVE